MLDDGLLADIDDRSLAFFFSLVSLFSSWVVTQCMLSTVRQDSIAHIQPSSVLLIRSRISEAFYKLFFFFRTWSAVALS